MTKVLPRDPHYLRDSTEVLMRTVNVLDDVKLEESLQSCLDCVSRGFTMICMISGEVPAKAMNEAERIMNSRDRQYLGYKANKTDEPT